MRKIYVLCACILVAQTAFSQWQTLKGPLGGNMSGLVKVGNDLLVSTNYGIFRSSDLAENWQLESNELRGIGISALFHQKNTLFAYSNTEKRFFTSADGGHHWQAVFSINLNPYVFQQVVATDSTLFFNDTKIKRSFDGGMTWESLTFPVPLQYYYTRMYVIGKKIYVVAPEQGIYRSDDEGNTWVSMTDNLPAKIKWGFVYEGGILAGYTLGGSKVVRSFNGGADWIFDQVPTQMWPNFSIFGADEDNIYAISNAKLWRSSKAGNTWEFASDATFLNQTNVPSQYQIQFYNFEDLLFATSNIGIHRSKNHGETWQDTKDGIAITQIRDIKVHNGAMLCAGQSGLYRYPHEGPWSDDLSEQFPVSQNTVWRLSEMEGEIYAGARWKLYRSVDTGQTWQAASPSLADYFSEVIKCGNDMLAATSRGIWRSADEGASWQHSSAGLSYVDIDVDVYPFVETLIKVGDTLLTPAFGRLYRSVDEGHSWSVADSFLSGNRLYHFDNQLFLVSGQVYRSTDSGASWQSVDFGHPDVVSGMARNDSLFFASTRGGVLVSKDRGFSWHFWGNNFPDSLWTTCISADNEFIYVGTQREGVWRHRVSDLVLGEPTPINASFELDLLRNPVGAEAPLRLNLPNSAEIRLLVFSLDGQLLQERHCGKLETGEHLLSIDLNNRAPGAYPILIWAGGQFKTVIAVKQ